MSLFKWTKAEIWCDFPECYNYITFEGNELKLLDWISMKGWKATRGFYFCAEHKDIYIKYIQDIINSNKERLLAE
jgi:hypothetical protein